MTFAVPRSSASDHLGLSQRAVKRPARRAKRRVESPDYAAFVRRVIRAFGRRAGEGDIDALPELAKLRDELDAAVGQAVRDLHAKGWSYAEIGNRLGVSRQNIRQRFGASTS
jgi:hypothetical protein